MDDEGGHFMRVRVTLDLTLPLCQGRVITLAVGGGGGSLGFPSSTSIYRICATGVVV